MGRLCVYLLAKTSLLFSVYFLLLPRYVAEPQKKVNGKKKTNCLFGRHRTTQCTWDFDAGYGVSRFFQHVDAVYDDLTYPNHFA